MQLLPSSEITQRVVIRNIILLGIDTTFPFCEKKKCFTYISGTVHAPLVMNICIRKFFHP